MKIVIIVVLIVIAAANLHGTIGGVIQSNNFYDKRDGEGCYSSLKPINFIVPGYRLGCWLNKPFDGTEPKP